MEILLYLDRCESTTTFPKSMLSLRNRLTPSLSRGTIFFPLSPHFSTGPQKQDIGLVPAVHQFIIGERTHRARSLTNQIKNNFLFRILSPAISIAIRGPYAVDQIISQIYIYILQHRSSKWSWTTPTKARKPRSLMKLIPARIRTVYNHMDKLTLTRQFRIQFVFGGMIFRDIKKELAFNNVDSYKRVFLQTLYL